MSECSAGETPVCCYMNVGTIMSDPDCTASYSRVFADHAETGETLTTLTEEARGVESGPCQIILTFTEESEDVCLDIDFAFAYGAETLIFQLGLR